MPRFFKSGTQNIVYHLVQKSANVNVKFIYNGNILGNTTINDLPVGSELSDNIIKNELINLDRHFTIESISIVKCRKNYNWNS